MKIAKSRLYSSRTKKHSGATMTRLTIQRKKMGLRLREVGEKLGITAQTVQQQEKRGIRSLRTARLYADALSCDWRDLIDDFPSRVSAGKQ